MSELVIKVRKLVIIFILGLLALIFSTIYFPLKKDIYHIQLINWSLVAQSRTYSFHQFIQNGMEAAGSVSSRTVIREKIEEYFENQITWDELQAFTQPKFEDGVRVLNDVAFAYRVVEGKVLVEFNPLQPVNYIDPSLIVTNDFPASEIVASKNEPFLFVSSPIKQNEKILGYDILFFRLSPVLAAISDQEFDIHLLNAEQGNGIRLLKQIEAGDNYQIFQDAGTVYYLELIPNSQYSVAIQAPYQDIFGAIQWRINEYLIVFFICLILIFLFANRQILKLADTLVKDLESSKEHYRSQAITDTLTGALSRFSLSQWLEHSRRKSCWSKPVVIVLLDIDQFKKINDQYGHETGDEVLCTLVQTAKNTLRKEDLLIRYGGDEFLIIFENLEREQVGVIMRRLEEQLAQNGQHDICLSISYGIEEVQRVNDFDDAIKRADEIMYGHKQRKHCLIGNSSIN
jgi:diguanylate cyclase (GGDEF)-like protein